MSRTPRNTYTSHVPSIILTTRSVTQAKRRSRPVNDHTWLLGCITPKRQPRMTSDRALIKFWCDNDHVFALLKGVASTKSRSHGTVLTVFIASDLASKNGPPTGSASSDLWKLPTVDNQAISSFNECCYSTLLRLQLALLQHACLWIKHTKNICVPYMYMYNV